MKELTEKEKLRLALRAIRHTPEVWSQINNTLYSALSRIDLYVRNHPDASAPQVCVPLPLSVPVLVRAHLQYLAIGRTFRPDVMDNAPVRLDWAVGAVQLSDLGELVLVLNGTYVRGDG